NTNQIPALKFYAATAGPVSCDMIVVLHVTQQLTILVRACQAFFETEGDNERQVEEGTPCTRERLFNDQRPLPADWKVLSNRTSRRPGRKNKDGSVRRVTADSPRGNRAHPDKRI